MSPGMSSRDAVAAVRAARSDRDVVITTMGPARDWMALGPLHPLDLVFVPSAMGHATSIGLGLALSQPARRIVVLNGDGSMLMNLGSLVSIASARPTNLVVVVFHNGVYEVTGGQPTPGAAGAGGGSRPVDFGALAAGCGWESVFRFSELPAWSAALPKLLRDPGPTFVTLEVLTGTEKSGPRSPGAAPERARRFMAALAEAFPSSEPARS